MMARRRESGGIRKFDESYEALDIIEVHALSEDLHINSNMSTEDAMCIYTYHLHALVNKYREFKNRNI